MGKDAKSDPQGLKGNYAHRIVFLVAAQSVRAAPEVFKPLANDVADAIGDAVANVRSAALRTVVATAGIMERSDLEFIKSKVAERADIESDEDCRASLAQCSKELRKH